MLCLLCLDQNLLAPNLTAIADSFGFSAHERDQKLGGNVAFGFFIVGGSFALIIGYFTDIVNRCMLFGVVVSLGETACLATYWVQNYEQLLVCRILTGISFGGATPIIYSILGDHYSGSSRIYVSTMVGVASGAGISFGQFLSGMIGPVLGWRAPFLIIAIPAIVCAVITFLTVDEPKRGECEDAVRNARAESKDKTTSLLSSPFQHSSFSVGNSESVLPVAILSPVHDTTSHTAGQVACEYRSTVDLYPALHTNTNTTMRYTTDTHLADQEEGKTSTTAAVEEEEEEDMKADADYSEKIELKKVLQLFQTPSVVIIFIQGFPGCLPWGMIYTFLNDYLSEDRGLTVQAATAALTCFGVGGLVGQVFGGWLGQRLYNKNPQWQAMLMGFSTLLAVFPALYILNTEQVGDLGFYFMSILFGMIVNINGPNVRAVLQNVCMPEIRGTAFSFFTLTDDIGKGLGPALVVLLIADFNGDRQSAFNTVVLMWIFCGMMLLALSLTMRRDERAMQQRMTEAMMQRRMERQHQQQLAQLAKVTVRSEEEQDGGSSSNSSKGMMATMNPMLSFPSSFPSAMIFTSVNSQQQQAAAAAGGYRSLANPSSSDDDIKVEDMTMQHRRVHFQSPPVTITDHVKGSGGGYSTAMSPETRHEQP